MKNLIFTLILVCFASVSLKAQTVLYQQDFEVSPMIMPSEIALFNVDGLTPAEGMSEAYADSAWIIGTSSRMSSKIAVANSWYVNDDGPADDWMVLPTISLGKNSVLSWDALSLTSSGSYPEDYQVICVQAQENGVSDTIQYFAENGVLLVEIIEENYHAEGVANREVNLAEKGFSEVDVWIAFRLVTPSGSELGLDNIVVTEMPVETGINEHLQNNIAIYPNPVEGSTTITNLNGEIEQIELYNIVGKCILRVDTKTKHSIELNLADFESGIYFATLKDKKGIVASKKIIKK